MTVAGGVTEIIPESVDLDGVNDYLSRSSDFVGNTDSKTFTFSCWVYWTGGQLFVYGSDASSAELIYVQVGGSGAVQVSMKVGGYNIVRYCLHCRTCKKYIYTYSYFYRHE